jgi:hypothetical protein
MIYMTCSDGCGATWAAAGSLKRAFSSSTRERGSLELRLHMTVFLSTEPMNMAVLYLPKEK